MAQNKIPPELQKLMAQMPNAGAEMPTLTGNANPLAAGMAMNAPAPLDPIANAERAPLFGEIGTTPLDDAKMIAGQLEGSRAGDFISTVGQNFAEGVGQFGRNLIGGPRAAANFLFSDEKPSVSEATSAAGIGLPQFSLSPREDVAAVETAQPAPMTTPESVAGPSITGTPLTQDTITSPSAQIPQLAPQGGLQGSDIPQEDVNDLATPNASGITKDGVFYPTQQPTGELKTYEDRLKGTIAAGEMTPQMKAQAAAEASPSASPEQVAIAMREDAERGVRMEADRAAEAFSSSLVGKGLPIAERERRVAEFRDKKLQEGLKGMDKPKTAEDIRSEQVKAQEDEKRLQLLDQKIEDGKSPNATTETKKAAARAQGVKDGTITQAQADEATKQDLIGKPPMGYATWAEYESSTGTDADGDGKVSTPAEAEAATPSDGGPTPAASIPTVNTQAEYDALPSGSQYIDSKGNQATKK